MVSMGRLWFAAAMLAGALAAVCQADTTTTEDVDGIRWEVTRRTMQVPVTQMGSQTQTVMRQQVTTQNVQHQQLYSVPVTQYQLVSTLHGRWNPFITPYWTHHYEPVTTWQQQTATVQIPVNTVAWAPETRTVQAPTTTYKTVEAIVSRRPLYALPGAAGGGASQQMLAAGSAASSGPTATLAARPTPSTSTAGATAAGPANVPAVASAPITYGGTQMTSDPPRQPTGGWQAPTQDRYNTGGRY